MGVYKPLNVDLSVVDFSNLMPHDSALWCSFFGAKAGLPETDVEIQRIVSLILANSWHLKCGAMCL